MVARLVVLVLTGLIAMQAGADLGQKEMMPFAADAVVVVIGCFFLGYHPSEKVG